MDFMSGPKQILDQINQSLWLEFSGGEEERDEIINNPGILSLLPTLLGSSEERLRLATLWLVINIIPE